MEQKLYQQGHINHLRLFTQAATRDIAYFEAGPHFRVQYQRKKYVVLPGPRVQHSWVRTPPQPIFWRFSARRPPLAAEERRRDKNAMRCDSSQVRASVSEGGAQSGAMSRDNTVTHYGQNCFRHSCNKDETKNVSDISMWMKKIKLGQDLPHDESLPHCNNFCELKIFLFMAHCIFLTNFGSSTWIWFCNWRVRTRAC